MFDYYHPKPGICCPICGAAELEWQGKDGPCALFVWEQGRPAPTDQLVDDDCKISAEDRSKHRFPTRFEIYAPCKCPTFLEAVGLTEHGIWVDTQLLNPANAVAYAHENEREFRERVAALAAHPGHRR